MKQYYCISDLHLEHENIRNFKDGNENYIRPIPYNGKQFSSLKEHDDCIIQQWNDTVSANATVYCLGDVVIRRIGLSKLKYLNGRKILVPGNHDIFSAQEYLEYFEDVRGYIVRNNVIFSHIPVHTCQMERYVVNVHGHTHRNLVTDNNGKVNVRYYNVCVEQCLHYKPIPMELIWQYRDDLLNKTGEK
jgi:calcineurin-like phosphoesterase family protein